jgi:hypothetical protein
MGGGRVEGSARKRLFLEKGTENSSRVHARKSETTKQKKELRADFGGMDGKRRTPSVSCPGGCVGAMQLAGAPRPDPMEFSGAATRVKCLSAAMPIVRLHVCKRPVAAEDKKDGLVPRGQTHIGVLACSAPPPLCSPSV